MRAERAPRPRSRSRAHSPLVDRRAGLVEHGRAPAALLHDRASSAARRRTARRCSSMPSSAISAAAARAGAARQQRRRAAAGCAERARGARDVEPLAAGRHHDALEAQHLARPQLARSRRCGRSSGWGRRSSIEQTTSVPAAVKQYRLNRLFHATLRPLLRRRRRPRHARRARDARPASRTWRRRSTRSSTPRPTRSSSPSARPTCSSATPAATSPRSSCAPTRRTSTRPSRPRRRGRS